MRSPCSDSRSGRSSGIAPATAASKYRSAPPSAAASCRLPPSSASSALFAVTTLLPPRSASTSHVRAGSMPPTTSTTTSMSSRLTRPSASVVNSFGSTRSGPRSRPGRRTAIPASSSGAPIRAVRSAACSCNSRTTSLPTVPQPSRATRTGSADIEGEEVIFGLPSYDQPGLPVVHRDHRRSRYVVVVAGHAATICAGAGYREKISWPHVGRQELILHQDVPGLAVLSHHASQQRAGLGRPAGESGAVRGVVQRGADVVAHPAVHAHVRADAVDILDRADLVQGEHGRPDDRTARLEREVRRVQPERVALLLDDAPDLL